MPTIPYENLNPEAFSTPLLTWFRAEKRAMPWRETRDPYDIWVSEVMLQQTQVATVIPYYERFISRFPTIQALAEAPLDDLLKHWEGLGYYSRARNLQKAAQQIVAEHGGVFPRDYTAIRALSGIGDYTAGAIASIAYNEPRPAVDGNVLRVLSRWFRKAEDVTKPQTKRLFEDLARRLIPQGHAWEYNQALMELGALVCAPRRPRCETCPVAAACHANHHGDPEAYPVKTKKAPPRPVSFAVAVLERGDRVWITRRPAEGLLGGLWEFPAFPLPAGEEPENVLEAGLKLSKVDWTPMGTVMHTYTHMKATMHVRRAEIRDPGPLPVDDDRRWVPVADLGAYAFSNANQKIMAALDARPLFRLPKA
jgi:A/G-specific adenine glycosylase